MNFRNGLFTALILLLFSSQGFTQTRSGNNIAAAGSSKLSIACGPAYSLKKDRTYSRLTKNGFNSNFIMDYEYTGAGRLSDFYGSLILGTLGTEGNDVNKLDNYSGIITFRYLWKINKLSPGILSVFAGINTSFRAEIWFPRQSFLRYGWDINTGLGGSAAVRYSFNSKLSCRYNMDIHLIGGLWRSHNNGQQLSTEEIQFERGILASAFENFFFSNIFNSLYIDNSVKLVLSASSNIDLFYDFTMGYRYIKEPLLKNGYELNNTIGISYRF